MVGNVVEKRNLARPASSHDPHTQEKGSLVHDLGQCVSGQIGTDRPIASMPCNPDLGLWWISISFWLPSILTPLPGEFEEAESTSYFASFLLKLGHSISIRF